MKLTLQVLLTLSYYITVIVSYDLILDTQKDTRYWKIQGNYFYAQNIVAGGSLAPNLKSDDETSKATKGVWYFKHAPLTYDNTNYFEMYFSLTHQLMYQVSLRFLAHPSVAVVVKNGQSREVATFWSSGERWCDAIITSRLLGAQIKIGVNLTEPGTYVMIDKVIMGVAGNITNLNMTNHNPCFTSPRNMSSSLQTEPDHFNLFTTSTTVEPSVLTTTSSDNQIVKVEAQSSASETEFIGDKMMSTSSSNESIEHRSQRHTMLASTNTTSLANDMNCQCSCTCARTSRTDG